MTPEMRRFVSDALRRARAATSLDEVYALADILEAEADEQVSQERTCSTCVSLGSDAGAAVCTNADAPVGEMSSRHAETFGCLLWQQAETKERGDV